MKNIKRMVAAALITVFAVGAAGCNMISKTEAGVKKSPVAKFDNTTITKGELDERMVGVQEYFKAQYGEKFLEQADAKEQYKAQSKQMLDSMIIEKIALKKAAEKKLAATDEEVNKKIEELKKTYKDEDLVKEGFKEGFNDPKFKENIKNGVILDKLVEDLIKDIKIEDKEAQDYYTNNQTEFTEQPNKIKLAHILVATEDEAKKVKERLAKGEDFGKLAKELSTDTGSKDNNGEYEVPYVGSGFDQAFMSAALAQTEGSISAPIQTQFGYHIIKTIKKTEYPVQKFETVKDKIKESLLAQKKSTTVNEAVTKWKEDAKIKTYEENL